MKTTRYPHNPVRVFLLYGTLVLTLFASSGCDFVSTPLKVESVATSGEMAFNAEFRYLVGYDQKTWSFTTQWPAGMIGSLQKNNSEDGFLLDRYELVRLRFAFDADGRVYSQTDWLEGDFEHTLPLSVYEQYKDVMPTHGDGHDPIVRSLVGNGQIRYVTKSGKTAFTYPIDPDAFKIDPAILEEIISHSQNPPNESQRRAEIANRLQSDGLAFRENGDNHFVISTPVNDDTGIKETRLTIDTRTGQVAQSLSFRENGELDSHAMYQYKEVNGVWVMEHSNTIHYGLRDGRWSVAGRTLVNRNNIRVDIK